MTDLEAFSEFFRSMGVEFEVNYEGLSIKDYLSVCGACFTFEYGVFQGVDDRDRFKFHPRLPAPEAT